MPPRSTCIRFTPLAILALLATLAGCSNHSHKHGTESAHGSVTAPALTPDLVPQARPLSTRNRIADLFNNDGDASSGGIAPYAVDHSSIWPRFSRNLRLDPGYTNAAIDRELNWYRQHPAYLYRASERAEPYLYHVVSEIEKRGMPMELALLPVVESAYDPFAYSRSGAAGMWQFIPSTGKHFGLRNNQWYDGRRDVVASTTAALDYLTLLHNKFGNDWLVAVAAYNFGEGNVQKAIDANRRLGKPTDFWSLSLREETRTYVPKLLALGRMIKAPQQYGISLHAIPNRPYFESVTVTRPLEFGRVAQLAGVDRREIQRLNPGYHHGLMEPAGAQQLLLPVGTGEQFKRQLASLPAEPVRPSQRYTVARGDTLSAIARRHGVSVAALQAANQLSGSNLRPGQTLAIPGQGSATTPVASAVPSGRQILYTVQAGDTPRRIATRHGVTVEELQRWNGLQADDPVKLGQRLSIWSRGSAPATVTAAAATSVAAANNQKVGYRVKSGDSLYGIANRYKIAVNDIMRWNQMSSHSLQAGQLLTLYVP